MKKKINLSSNAFDLRERAEEELSKRKKKVTHSREMDVATQRLFHELQVHQIELEMQNEELIQTRTTMNTLLDQYTDLYDFAPAGYFTLARDGAIRKANFAGAQMLGAERGKLIKRRFGVFVSVESRKIFSAFLESVFESGQKKICEVALQSEGHVPHWVHVEATCSEDGQECRAVMSNITERKQADDLIRKGHARYQNLFESSPIAIWEEDFSQVMELLNRLRKSGVDDFERYFNEHPEAVNECRRLVKILDVNHIGLKMIGANDKSEILGSLSNTTSEDSFENFKRELTSLANGNLHYEGENIYYSKQGMQKNALMHCGVVPGFEDTFGKVIISFIDITEHKQVEEDMRQRMIELEMLYESGLALNQMTTSKQIGQKVIELFEQKMDWHHTVIRLYDPRMNTLQILALSMGNKQAEMEVHEQVKLISQPGEGMTGWAIQHSEVVRSGDLNHDPRYKETIPGMNSGIYVPMKSLRQMIGVISIESEQLNAFSKADERLVITLANQAAVALENAQLNSNLEQRVKDRTAEVQDLYNNAPTGYHSLDENGVIIMINQTELNWLGYNREEVVGIKSFNDITTPLGRKVFAEKFPLLKTQGWVKDVEADVVRKDGSTFPVLLNATAIYDANRNFLSSRTTIFDITERKYAEEEARKLSQAIEHSPASVVITNRDGIIEYVNPAFCEVTGYTRDEALGQNPRIIKSNIHSLEFYQAMWATLTAGQPWHGEFCNKRKNGELYWEYASISPVRNEHDEITHYVEVKEDVTERKKAEQALRESRDELSMANIALEKAARLKDEFLASMSHELRTPLTGILGFSEVLQLKAYGDLSEKQIKAVRNIEDSGRHLLDLINDILDLSKIEAGKVELQFAPCSLADICQASLQLIKGMAQQKLQLVHYSAPDEPVLIYADARRIKQILVNLLSNAVKFTAEGGELGLEVQANESERNIKLTIWDKGIGIKPEDTPKLFKPFTQIDGSLARQYSGTGLGLSLVSHLTELHNGGIQVESIPGEGSRFTVILPWSPHNTIPLPDVPRHKTGKLPSSLVSLEHSQLPLIMIADDNETVLQMMADFLETQPYRVIKVRSGVELLEWVAKVHPDVILVDIQMPDIDGLETIRRIRTHTDPLIAETPIIAITALAMPGDRERCLAAGANEYMSKPVKLTELAETIQKQIKKE